jgi:bisphosphoglycerate-dependent phosphoglycerate mutase
MGGHFNIYFATNDTRQFLPWSALRDVIVPEIMTGKTVLIVAHGTSLR